MSQRQDGRTQARLHGRVAYTSRRAAAGDGLRGGILHYLQAVTGEVFGFVPPAGMMVM